MTSPSRVQALAAALAIKVNENSYNHHRKVSELPSPAARNHQSPPSTPPVDMTGESAFKRGMMGAVPLPSLNRIPSHGRTAAGTSSSENDETTTTQHHRTRTPVQIIAELNGNKSPLPRSPSATSFPSSSSLSPVLASSPPTSSSSSIEPLSLSPIQPSLLTPSVKTQTTALSGLIMKKPGDPLSRSASPRPEEATSPVLEHMTKTRAKRAPSVSLTLNSAESISSVGSSSQTKSSSHKKKKRPKATKPQFQATHESTTTTPPITVTTDKNVTQTPPKISPTTSTVVSPRGVTPASPTASTIASASAASPRSPPPNNSTVPFPRVDSKQALADAKKQQAEEAERLKAQKKAEAEAAAREKEAEKARLAAEKKAAKDKAEADKKAAKEAAEREKREKQQKAEAEKIAKEKSEKEKRDREQAERVAAERERIRLTAERQENERKAKEEKAAAAMREQLAREQAAAEAKKAITKKLPTPPTEATATATTTTTTTSTVTPTKPTVTTTTTTANTSTVTPAKPTVTTTTINTSTVTPAKPTVTTAAAATPAASPTSPTTATSPKTQAAIKESPRPIPKVSSDYAAAIAAISPPSSPKVAPVQASPAINHTSPAMNNHTSIQSKPKIDLGTVPTSPPQSPKSGHTSPNGNKADILNKVERLREDVEKLRKRTDDYVASQPAIIPYVSEKITTPSLPTAPVINPSPSSSPSSSPIMLSPRAEANGHGEEKIFMQGWMEKEGQNVRNWKRRWIVLYRSRIDYFVQPSDKSAKGTIRLDTCTVSPMRKRDGVTKPCLEIIQAGRRWHLTADTANDNTVWYSAILTRITAVSYVRRSEMSKQTPDVRIIEFLETHSRTTNALDGKSSSTNTAVTLSLNDKPLTLDAISVLARILSDAGMQPVSCLEVMNASLGSLEIGILIDAFLSHPASTLTTLNFSGNAFAKESIKSMSKMLIKTSVNPLEALILDNCAITNEMLEYLLQLHIDSHSVGLGCPLKTLVLSHNQIGCRGVSALMKLLTGIQSTGARPVGWASQPPGNEGTQLGLVHLNLAHNRIADRGAEIISKILYTNNTLLHLSLRDNEIADIGAQALANALRVNETLIVFDIAVNDGITHTGAQSLSHMCQQNSMLEDVSFLDYHLDRQGLTVMRLIYNYGIAEKPQEGAGPA